MLIHKYTQYMYELTEYLPYFALNMRIGKPDSADFYVCRSDRLPAVCLRPSRKHAYIILTPLNPIFI